MSDQDYGYAADAVADAPGRVNLLGEHTDYNDGFVLPVAIAQRTRVAMRRNGSTQFALHAWKVIHDAEGENDSLVSVKSSSWGKHLGTWPADHWQTINIRFVPDLIKATGDVAPYYAKAVDAVIAAL